MDDGLTLSRSQREESYTARLIRNASFLFTRFIRYWIPHEWRRSFTNMMRVVSSFIDHANCYTFYQAALEFLAKAEAMFMFLFKLDP